MITKAIIETIEDEYSYRVRIPLINRSSGSSFKTAYEDLPIAYAAIPPGCLLHYALGDVVLVGFEENRSNLPIILGQLYREDKKEDSVFIVNTPELNVSLQANLPYETSIGTVNDFNIETLKSANGNLQSLIDLLDERVAPLKELPVPTKPGTYTYSLKVDVSDKNVITYNWVELLQDDLLEDS